MEQRIKELKEEREKLNEWLWTLEKAYGYEEDTEFREKEEAKTEKELEVNRRELFQLTGDYKYATIEEVVKKYQRPYYEFLEYGPISISELNKRKQAKIEIIKKKHKENGITNWSVTMNNIHAFHVEKAELEEYLSTNPA